jgi:hypothetical protein
MRSAEQFRGRASAWRIAFVLCGLIAAAVAAFAQSASAPTGMLAVSTSSFTVGGTIPKQFTCDGEDLSPALSWTGAAAGTKSFALIVDDPDAPAGTWTHWVIWNIPAGEHELRQGLPKDGQLNNGARQGRNDFRKVGYNGPCPPPGKPHRYFLKLFALDAPLEVNAAAGRAAVESAMRGHVLAKGEVMGHYGR